MTTQNPLSPDDNGNFQDRLDALDQRLSQIEEFLDYKLAANLRSPEIAEPGTSEKKPELSQEAAESQYGEQVFSWISSVIVLFLVIFLMIFFQNKEKDGLAIIVGYAATGGVFIFSQLLRKSFHKQVYLLRITSHILLFYVSLWLHFFSENPIITGNTLGMAVLALPIAYHG